MARTLCPMKIITSGEILYRLDDNWHLVYSPKGQTLNIICPSRQAHKLHQFIQKGISKFRLPTGWRTELADHFVYSDSTISSDSVLEHIELPDVVSLNIPNVSPKHLEAIMSEMTKDGLYRPTTNDIIEAHEHLEDLSHQTSVSMIVWIVFAIVLYHCLHLIYLSFFFKCFDSKQVSVPCLLIYSLLWASNNATNMGKKNLIYLSLSLPYSFHYFHCLQTQIPQSHIYFYFHLSH